MNKHNRGTSYNRSNQLITNLEILEPTIIMLKFGWL